MRQKKENDNSKPELVTSPRPFFAELIGTASNSRGIEAPAITQDYLVNLLEHFMFAGNLFGQDSEEKRRSTLAETLMQAQLSEPRVRLELLKQLGDSALYISGFFGDSLQRKLVDIEYYAEMGQMAYVSLADGSTEKANSHLFSDLGRRFLEYVDLLTIVSQQSLIQTNADLLRLYDRYLTTGSKLAEQQLIERGVLAAPRPIKGKIPLA